MQSASHAATCDFLSTIHKPVNVETLRALKLESEGIADGDPSTYFLAFGCSIRSEFYGEDADDDTAPEIDWDTVARFTDEWLDSDVHASMRTEGN